MNHPGKVIEARVLELIRHRAHFMTFHRILRPEFFTNDTTQAIFNQISAYYAEHASPKLALSDLFALFKVKASDPKGLQDVKNALSEMRKQRGMDSIATREIVVQWAKRALLREALFDGLDQIERGNGVKIDSIRDKIDLAATVGVEEDNQYGYFRLYQQRLEEPSVKHPIPTGLPTIDEMLEGGLDRGELGLFIGPTHRGKTRALVNLGVHALELGKKVLHFIVCDSTANRIAKRYDSILTNKIYSTLREDPETLIEHLKRIKQAGAKLTIKEYDRFAPTPNDLRHWLKEYVEKAENKPDLLILDYLDELKANRHYKEYRFESRDITSSVRRVAAEFECPIWTASQGNRGSMSKRLVGLDDVSEDLWKSNISDVVVTLNQNDEEHDEQIIRYRLIKARRENFIPRVVTCQITDAGRVYEPDVRG